MKVLRNVITVFGLVVASTTCAQPLDIAIDIDSTRGAPAGSVITTQPGFTSWDLTNVGADSDPFVVDGVTFQVFGLGAANKSRLRASGGDGTFNSVLRDFVFNESSTGSGQAVGLRVTGLELGAYAMQSWHYDSDGSVTSTSNFVNVETRDQGVADSTITHVSGHAFSTTPAFFKFDVTEVGQVKEIIFREADSDADGGTDNNRSRLNGFTLRAVPEPSSLALAALGCVLFLGRRRHGNL